MQCSWESVSQDGFRMGKNLILFYFFIRGQEAIIGMFFLCVGLSIPHMCCGSVLFWSVDRDPGIDLSTSAGTVSEF